MSPTCRVLGRNRASASHRRIASSRLARAKGTKYFMAACAPRTPDRTCCWIGSGSAMASPMRRLTQLGLLSKRRPNSSSPSASACAARAATSLAPEGCLLRRTHQSLQHQRLGLIQFPSGGAHGVRPTGATPAPACTHPPARNHRPATGHHHHRHLLAQLCQRAHQRRSRSALVRRSPW